LILPALIDWRKNKSFYWKNLINWTGSDCLGNPLLFPEKSNFL